MRTSFQKRLFAAALLFISIILSISHPIFAAEIFRAKGKKAIVKLESLIVKKGDVLVVHASGLKKADIRVKKIKRNFALVDIISGRVSSGDSVSQSKNVRILASETSDEYDYNDDEYDISEPETTSNTGEYLNTSGGYSDPTRKKFAIGLFGGMNYNILKLKLPNNSYFSNRVERKNVLATGLAYSTKVALDYKVLDTLGLRAFTGWQHLHASSKDSRNVYVDLTECYDPLDPLRQQRDCELKLDMYTISVQLQYYPTMDNEYLQAWVGLGGSMNFVIKTRTNYALQSVNTMGTVMGIIGADVRISPEIYLAFQADYNFSLASSSTVQAHFISAKVGLMYKL